MILLQKLRVTRKQNLKYLLIFPAVDVVLQNVAKTEYGKYRNTRMETYSMKLRTFPTGKHRARQIGEPPFAIVPFHFHSSLRAGS